MFFAFLLIASPWLDHSSWVDVNDAKHGKTNGNPSAGCGIWIAAHSSSKDRICRIQTVTDRLVQLIAAHEIQRSSMPTAGLSPDVISFWDPLERGSLEQRRFAIGLLNKKPVEFC